MLYDPVWGNLDRPPKLQMLWEHSHFSNNSAFLFVSPHTPNELFDQGGVGWGGLL